MSTLTPGRVRINLPRSPQPTAPAPAFIPLDLPRPMPSVPQVKEPPRKP